MSTPEAQASTRTGRLNKLAVTAVILAAVAAAGFFLSMAVLAAFAVGAGHVALNQIRQSGEKGRGLALAALGIGYPIAIWGLFTTLSFLPFVVQNLTR